MTLKINMDLNENCPKCGGPGAIKSQETGKPGPCMLCTLKILKEMNMKLFQETRPRGIPRWILETAETRTTRESYEVYKKKVIAWWRKVWPVTEGDKKIKNQPSASITNHD